ncbi:hypothetical protein CLOSTMETH_02968 [[Clostridium] methylpentosum DSM 5476]|uniref:Uncharacterized protein n=1 Tax=[Clostridium] methylpentosum DSM 5476 TaxID=537013 RepID=C0EGH5_9FIRM|nr:hypothetical protein CLOSTMETH_02968 [[Clostridium] methylpentosum DSM 5476]
MVQRMDLQQPLLWRTCYIPFRIKSTNPFDSPFLKFTQQNQELC